MRSALAPRPSLHAFAWCPHAVCVWSRVCMRRMSSAAASDPSRGDRALHEPFAIGGQLNLEPSEPSPLYAVCPGRLVSAPGVGGGCACAVL